VRDARSSDDLKVLAAALSHYQIDATSGFVFLDQADFEKTWQAHRAKRLAADTAFTPRERREWHLQAALDCLDGSAADAALHHLDVVLRQERGNAMLHFMRAQAWEALGDEVKTTAEYDQAIALEPRCRKLSEDRGWLHLRRNRYAEAAIDFAKVIDIGTEEFRYWHHLALLYLSAGKTQDYRALCSKMLDNLEPEGAVMPEDALSTLVLQPTAVAPARLLAVVTALPKDLGFQRPLSPALALYRAGKPADAVAYLEDFLKKQVNVEPRPGPDLAWAALIYHQAGRQKEAESWHRRAVAWREKDGKPAAWADRAEFDLVFAELQALRKSKG
jgi:Tfp pilus assembly protein PilF